MLSERDGRRGRAEGEDPPLVVGIEDVNGGGLGAGDQLREAGRRVKTGRRYGRAAQFNDYLQKLVWES